MARRNKKPAAKTTRTLAAEIRQLRARLGLSQGQFAQAIGGVSQQTVSDWEKGKRLRQLEIALRLLRWLSPARQR